MIHEDEPFARGVACRQEQRMITACITPATVPGENPLRPLVSNHSKLNARTRLRQSSFSTFIRTYHPRRCGLGGFPLRAPFSTHPPERAETRSSPKRGPSDSPTYFRGVAKAALYCAHRTSTASPCAFCEQEGYLAAPLHPSQAARCASKKARPICAAYSPLC